MPSHKMIFYLTLILLLITNRCATFYAPTGWLDEPEQVSQSVYGGWIEVEFVDSGLVMGELIAIGQDSLFIADSLFRAIPLAQIKAAELIFYDSQYGLMASWTFLGTLSTLSHGFGLVLTGPLWVLFGSAITSARSWEPVIKYPDEPWEKISSYSRFPQGLPAHIDRKRIVMKKPTKST
ncbi:MAG: hypothetical protein EHM72_19170 [Calditrichaeota bacterium]|nr:MAG: hypothetical protein EHM72_19170 [Calditrichota bacterium]